jgi:hypothetical protein
LSLMTPAVEIPAEALKIKPEKKRREKGGIR